MIFIGISVGLAMSVKKIKMVCGIAISKEVRAFVAHA